jgi:glycosyltransferase involved in cell wall biosynthesis
MTEFPSDQGPPRSRPGPAPTPTSERPFDPAFYLEFYPDVAASLIDPTRHYNDFGRAEGRLPYRLRTLAAERDLWLGFTRWALPDLTALADDDDPRERGAALWALMRWYAAEGKEGAQDALARLWSDRAARKTLRGRGVCALALTILIAADDIDRARAIVRLMARHAPAPDVALARVALAVAGGKAQDGINQTLTHCLAPAYGRAGLAVPVFHGRHAHLFDRLAALPGWHAENAPASPLSPPRAADGRIGRLAALLRQGHRNLHIRAQSRLNRQTPLVSVIVPARNAADQLPTALAGLLGQSWQALEIIVIDDGSTDDTRAVAQLWARHDPRIRVLAGQGLGTYAARNLGMAAARGAFLTVHDADDWSHPAKIAEQVRPLAEQPGLAATVSHWARVDDDMRPQRWPMNRIEGWVHRNVSSLMIRRAVLQRLGFWDRVRAGGDTEYYYRVLAAYGPGAITEVHPGLPLSFGRTGAATLTHAPETHLRTRYFGARRDYEDASLRWHDRARSLKARLGGRAFHLPQYPERRPFAAPPALCLGDPEARLASDDLIRHSPVFDARWYLEHNPDVRADGICPAVHYDRAGAAEGRDPGPGFSTTGYRIAHGVENVNPLVHWETVGRAGGLAALPQLGGARADSPGPRVIVCAHQAGPELFGAERSFLDMLDRIGDPASGVIPVAVLPGIGNLDYLSEVRARVAAVHLVPMPWWHVHRPPHPATLAALRAVIAQHGAATVHVNTAVLQAPRLAGRAAGARVVVHLREMPAQDAAIRDAVLGSDAAPEPPVPETAEWIRLRLLAEADHFVANSAMAAAWLDCPDRVTVVGNRIDPGLFDLPFAPQTPLRVALISSNIAKKGIGDAVAVAADLGGRGIAARLLLIGPHTPDLAALHPLPANVEAPGYAPTPVAALEGADVVLCLSRFAESFGRTVLEAMAAGRPVISYDRGHPPHLIGRGHDAGGIIVPADDIAAVSQALSTLVADPAALTSLSQAARLRAHTILGEGR